MDKAEELFLAALRSALHGDELKLNEKPEQETLRRLFRLAREQSVLPLVTQSLAQCAETRDAAILRIYTRLARAETLRQARRTGDFLLLLRQLSVRGLRPAVLKGIVCRRLYPEPEQRPSSDEDLLISPEDFPRYHDALLACGLRLKDPDRSPDGEDEVTYIDPDRDLYLEVHLRPFSDDDGACGDCSRAFADALSRAVPVWIYGQSVYTLAPTDHLLYLICHAYKHILYGGVGLRQICDICLVAQHFFHETDWELVRHSCEDLGILSLAGAFFRVGQRWLSLSCPSAFADPELDELPLLIDCLSGGVYGAEDPDRLHSSRITLEAVASARQGWARRGLWNSLFPGKDYLQSCYPYARRYPILLPVAWAQRILRYAFGSRSSAARSLQIGRERVELLRKYKIMP